MPGTKEQVHFCSLLPAGGTVRRVVPLSQLILNCNLWLVQKGVPLVGTPTSANRKEAFGWAGGTVSANKSPTVDRGLDEKGCHW